MPAKVWTNRRWACAAQRPVGEQRIVGRVVDRIGETEQRAPSHLSSESRSHAGDRQGRRAEGESADQHRAHVDAIDRSPAGICSVPETTLNAISACPSST